jgi:hypothetical protein
MISVLDLKRNNFFVDTLNPILNSMNDSLYPLNLYTGYHLALKNYITLKTFSSENLSSNCGRSFYTDKISHFTSNDIAIASDWLNSHSFDYFYIGSKISLKSNFFSNFLPSAFDFLYSHLLENNCIRQIGSGPGSVILFNSSLLSEPISFSFDFHSNEDMVQNFQSFIHNYNNLQNDNRYLSHLIDQKNASIANLTKTIDELEHKNYLNTRMTWN